MRVRITGSWGWYGHRVGEEFEVELVDGRYIVEGNSFPDEFEKNTDRLSIRPSDCEEAGESISPSTALEKLATLEQQVNNGFDFFERVIKAQGSELTEAREHTETLVAVCQRILERDTLAGARQKLRNALKAIDG